MKGSPLRRARPKAVAVGFGLLLLLAAAGEVGFRIRYAGIEIGPDWDLLTRPDPDLGRRFVPGSLVDFNLLPGQPGRPSIPVRINRLGYRGPDPPRVRTPGTFRIACLGDSTTFGWMVREEAAYPSLLPALLGARAGGRKVECMNFGAPEHTTFRAAFVLEKDALPLRPDLVVFAYGFNDADVLEDEEVVRARRRANPESLLAWRVRRALAWSYLFRWFEAKATPRARAASPAPSLVRRVSPEKMEANLRRLIGRAKEGGAESILVDQNIPSSYGREVFRRAAEDVPLLSVRELLFPGFEPPAPRGNERGLAACGDSPADRPSVLLRALASAGETWDVVGLRSAPGATLLDRERLRDDGTGGDERAGDGVHSLLDEGPFVADRIEFAFVPADHVSEAPGLFRTRQFFFREEAVPLRPSCRVTALLSPFPPSPPMLPGDVVHPDSEGHRRIAEALADAIAATASFRRFASR